MDVHRLTKEELHLVAEIAKASFSGLKEKEHAIKWVECNFYAHPRTQYFIAKEVPTVELKETIEVDS